MRVLAHGLGGRADLPVASPAVTGANQCLERRTPCWTRAERVTKATSMTTVTVAARAGVAGPLTGGPPLTG